MAVTSMMQRLLDNALTAKFAKSLNHSDLPEGWADNPEIVQLAEDAYSVMGTESPWFKAWFGDYSPGKAYKFATEGDPVASITGREFQPDGTSLTDRVVQYYKDEYGGKVERPGLGKVNLGKKAVKNDTFHKNSSIKSAGFASVPDVIQKGEFFTRDYNWKGRGYDTSGYIAPVDVNGERFAEEVILEHKPNSTLLYKHELEPIKKLEEAYKNAVFEQMPDIAVTTPRNNEAASHGTRLILPKVLEKVNPVSKVVDDKGNPLHVFHNTDELFDTFDISKARQDSDIPAFFFSSGTDDWADMGGNTIEAFLNIKNPTSKPVARGRGREVREDLERKGYDGTIEAEDGMETEYAAFFPNQIKAVANRGTFNPADPNIYKGIIPAVGTGGLLGLMGASEAQAAIPGEDYVFPAQRPGYVTPDYIDDKPLESPLVDPADLLTAPIGVPTAALKAASVAAEPFISYGMDKAINGLLGLFSDEEE